MCSDSVAAGRSRVVRWRFAYPAAVAFAVALGLWLRWPTLSAGFASDDFIEPAMLDGVYPAPRGPLDLFDFVRGTPEDNRALMHYGAVPWWTAPNLRLSMLRPLASAQIILDRRLFGTNPVPYHVVSTLWWVALMLVAAALFKRLFSRPVACIAIVLFALEEGHTLPLSWLANRAAIVAMFFGVLGLLWHLRFREDGARAGAWVELACFSIAMLTGEWAFPLLGYVLAYELLYQRGPLWQRALALCPSGIPGALFLAARSLLGYGALNSGVYIDPVTEPWTFFVSACQRIPIFFGDLFFSVPANWWAFGSPWRDWLLSLGIFSPQVWVRLPSWHFWQVTIGVLAIGATVLTLRWGLRDRPKDEGRQIRWMLAGACISLLPMVASYPTSRLVLPASLAASAACAIVLLRGIARARERWGKAPGAVVLSLCVSLLVAYFQVWQAARTTNAEAHLATAGFRSIREQVLRAPIDDSKIANQHLVLVNSIEHTSTIFGPFLRHFYGHPLPRSSWVLSGAPHAHDIYRPSANTLELSVLGGTLMESEFERLYRADRLILAPGETIDIGGMRVTILRLLSGRPQTLRFTFDKDIDDPSYLFLVAAPEGMVRARLPEIGQRFRYRKAPFPNGEIAENLREHREIIVQCVGVRPPIDECRVGYFFAECGGSGDPVFACHGLGDCRWFLHACVAEGYVPSVCSSAAVSCNSGSPFDTESFLHEPPYTQIVAGELGALGKQPWDAERDMTLDVTVDPKLLQTTPSVVCSGPHTQRGPCSALLPSVEVAQPQQSSLHFAWGGPSPRAGWLLSVEIIDDVQGRLRARVCRVAQPSFDVFEVDGITSALAGEPVCANAGKLVISGFPVESPSVRALAARVDAVFPDGATIRASF